MSTQKKNVRVRAEKPVRFLFFWVGGKLLRPGEVSPPRLFFGFLRLAFAGRFAVVAGFGLSVATLSNAVPSGSQFAKDETLVLGVVVAGFKLEELLLPVAGLPRDGHEVEELREADVLAEAAVLVRETTTIRFPAFGFS